MLTDDVVASFRAVAERAGITIDCEIVPDGRLHRFRAREDRVGSRNSWYVLHMDARPAGTFGSWRLGINQNWVSSAELQLTEAERQANIRRIVADQKRRSEEQAQSEVRARARAEFLWRAVRPADPGHAYLVRKGIAAHGARTGRGLLILPLYDERGALHSLQFIAPSGEKRFLRGGRVAGCFCTLAKPEYAAELHKLYVAEGFATAATIQEATGGTVAVAFNSGNLVAVARAIRSRMSEVELVICADNDAWTPGNPGLTAARKAALAVQGRLAIPRFSRGGSKPTDFNDLAELEGLDAVREQLRKALFPLNGY